MATEKRLIDANEFLNWLVKRFHCIPLVGSSDLNSESMKFLLSQAPTVDAVEVVHGRWAGYHEADIGYDEYGVRCSNCNFEVEDNEVDFIMNYCPNCGAKMRGSEE